MGWHKRKTRDYCLSVFEQYKGLDFETFTGLVRSFFGYDENVDSSLIYQEPQAESGSSFAQRLITGLAAERYFESIHTELPEFDGYLMENTTRFGCGYDFRLRTEPNDNNFLAVEVKGLKEQHGSLSMTPKEYDVASILRDRFFLFVVRACFINRYGLKLGSLHEGFALMNFLYEQEAIGAVERCAVGADRAAAA
jgi:hypothetical protein